MARGGADQESQLSVTSVQGHARDLIKVFVAQGLGQDRLGLFMIRLHD